VGKNIIGGQISQKSFLYYSRQGCWMADPPQTNSQIHKFESQASELIKLVREHGGAFHVFTDIIRETETVVALLAILSSQMEALGTYAEMIQIDGTYPQLSLR
jgi:hypothetical protein